VADEMKIPRLNRFSQKRRDEGSGEIHGGGQKHLGENQGPYVRVVLPKGRLLLLKSNAVNEMLTRSRCCRPAGQIGSIGEESFLTLSKGEDREWRLLERERFR
jgi:hypothetical protein